MRDRMLGFLLVVMLVVVSILGCSSGSAATHLPPGVKESQWRALGPDLDMVIRSVETGKTVGYFTSRVDG